MGPIRCDIAVIHFLRFVMDIVSTWSGLVERLIGVRNGGRKVRGALDVGLGQIARWKFFVHG